MQERQQAFDFDSVSDTSPHKVSLDKPNAKKNLTVQVEFPIKKDIYACVLSVFAQSQFTKPLTARWKQKKFGRFIAKKEPARCS